MRHAIAVLALISGFAAADVCAATDAEIIQDVFYSFSNGEQRLIRTMTVHSSADGEFQAGLRRVLGAKSDPAALEAEKKRFRLQWRGKVSDWAARYAAGDKAIMGQMGAIAKPSREAFGRAAPWMEKIDQEHFSGGLYDGVIGKMNPYEAAYSIAGLQGLSKAKAAETEQKLRDNAGYPTRLVAGFILDDTRKKFQGDLKDVGTAYARDRTTVLAQLQGIEAASKLAKNHVDPEAAGETGADFDGSGKKTKTGSDPSAAVKDQTAVPAVGKGSEVPAETKKEMPKEGVLAKAPAAATGKSALTLKEPPPPALPKPPSLTASLNIPPPRTDDAAFESRKGSSGAGIGTMLKAVFSKPMVARGTGALLGGLLGFLLGGPIGAAIGAIAGAVAGNVAASKLKD